MEECYFVTFVLVRGRRWKNVTILRHVVDSDSTFTVEHCFPRLEALAEGGRLPDLPGQFRANKPDGGVDFQVDPLSKRVGGPSADGGANALEAAEVGMLRKKRGKVS